MGHSSGGQFPLRTISGGCGSLTQSKPPLGCWHPPAPECSCASVREQNCSLTKLLSMPIRPHILFCYIIVPILRNVFPGYWFPSPIFHPFLGLRLLRIVTEHLQRQEGPSACSQALQGRGWTGKPGAGQQQSLHICTCSLSAEPIHGKGKMPRSLQQDLILPTHQYQRCGPA